MAEDMTENKLQIFKGMKGEVVFDGDAEGETIWATQAQISQLLGVDRTVIGRHIRNIFNTGELDEKKVCAKNAHTTRREGERKRGASRLPQVLYDGFHLSSREDLAVGLVAHGGQGIPQAACELHLLAEEAHGTALISVGVVELGQLAEAVTLNSKWGLPHRPQAGLLWEDKSSFVATDALSRRPEEGAFQTSRFIFRLCHRHRFRFN